MTPTATRLQARLNERRRWFINEWFFKWHHIGSEKGVEIDTFDGRQANYAGIKFWGSPRLIFWDAVTRGVRKEVTEQFSWVDEEIRRYNVETAQKAISECAGLLASFCLSIRREAVAKDILLRGDGVNFPDKDDAGNWHGTSSSEINEQASALLAALPNSLTQQMDITHKEQPIWWEKNKNWAEPIGWGAGLLTGFFGIVELFF